MTDITDQLRSYAPIVDFTESSPQYTQFDKASHSLVKSTQYLNILFAKKTIEDFLRSKFKSLTKATGLEQHSIIFLATSNKQLDSLNTLLSPQKHVQIYQHAVIACLYSHISNIAAVFSTQLTKQVQKIKSDFIDKEKLRQAEREKIVTSSYTKPKPAAASDNPELIEENQILLENFTKERQQIENTQRSLYELNSLLGFFAQKVLEHEQMSERILETTHESVSYMKTANRHLFSANEYSKGVGFMWAFFFIGMSVLLVFYDWWTATVVYYNP